MSGVFRGGRGGVCFAVLLLYPQRHLSHQQCLWALEIASPFCGSNALSSFLQILPLRFLKPCWSPVMLDGTRVGCSVTLLAATHFSSMCCLRPFLPGGAPWRGLLVISCSCFADGVETVTVTSFWAIKFSMEGIKSWLKSVGLQVGWYLSPFPRDFDSIGPDIVIFKTSQVVLHRQPGQEMQLWLILESHCERRGRKFNWTESRSISEKSHFILQFSLLPLTSC